MSWWVSLGRAVLDVLYPRDCVLCAQPVESAMGYLCEACRQKAWPHHHGRCAICAAESGTETKAWFLCEDCRGQRPAFERAFVALCYYGKMQRLIQQFKYYGGLWLVYDWVYFLEMVYVREVLGQGIMIDGVVPVPATRAKVRQRGYNQAALLARVFAKKVGLPCEERLLLRRPTKAWAQARLQRKARLVHAQEAYKIACNKDLSGRTMLLIDDVMTTGSTVNACAMLLRQMGAKVYVLALARPLFG